MRHADPRAYNGGMTTLDTDLAFLLDLTATPTAAGHEGRVIAKIEAWLSERPHLRLDRDTAGNLVLSASEEPLGDPLYITAHLDHPAFVVDRVESSTVHLFFRGGVRDPFFPGTAIDIHSDAGPVRATITEAGKADPDRPVSAKLGGTELDSHVDRGQIATWALPEAEIDGDTLRTNACDDLAAVAAALMAFDELTEHGAPETPRPVRLLFTLAEEIGFIGAIAACKLGTMPAGSLVVALENSRSYPHDSPIGGGPILRVGDRMSTFDPALTGACAEVATEMAKADETFKWQRKLMPGGACEATAFCAYGYSATCLCLPLGNYHNMANLLESENEPDRAEVLAMIEREYISVSDWRGLVRWLVAIGRSDLKPPFAKAKMEELYGKRADVLGAPI